MAFVKQIGLRRAGIRKNRPDRESTWSGWLLRPEFYWSVVITVLFVALTTAILMLRPNVVPWRVGQYVPHDVVARVNFDYQDAQKLDSARNEARVGVSRRYRPLRDPFANITDVLIALPDQGVAQREVQLVEPYRGVFDDVSISQLAQDNPQNERGPWKARVDAYVRSLQSMQLVIIPDKQRKQDFGRSIMLEDGRTIPTVNTLSPTMVDELETKFIKPASENFNSSLTSKIVALTIKLLTPNFEMDDLATKQAENLASAGVPESRGNVSYSANMLITEAGEIDAADYTRLKAEHEAYLQSLGWQVWWQRLGLFSAVLVLTAVACSYIVRYQPRIIRNHARALGLVALTVSMLFLAQLTGLGSTRSYVFGIAPTIMVAMILAIAYDQRFAIGIGCLHAVLATLALGEGLNFFIIVITGVAACCFLLEDVRTRSKLVEVGGGVALAMMAAAMAAGWLEMDPAKFIFRNAIYAGAAGLAVGFLTLGILPFIEKMFRITTSMTLLELADASHPLLRRLAVEAPGTYNHSLQVAALSEEAAEAIGANSLLCRVASYYHDVGKINKSEYFVENQQPGDNRHINLSPSVSLLIIIGHVKDGVELAREYALPGGVVPFIQQHHGTTLVEFFYHRACAVKEAGDPTVQQIQEHQYRYPGPKPRSKEVAIVMLADCCESACRAMEEPNASRIETLVHELAMKRLTDGQFNECDLTMRELELVERSLMKSLIGLYHGRIQYPRGKADATTAGPKPTPPLTDTPLPARTA